ncbi:hypothetical protein RND81_10G047300 [Saponaria officinalis]|uniref:WRKY domain-containing protein n=1 Tax=Saponaria officinalis TaxID=3572 RepID=A0AAW1HZ08_SAPOF
MDDDYNNNNNPLNLILHACNLAKDLEAQLPNLSANYYNNNINYPQIISQKCDEIISVFSMAKHHFDSLNTGEHRHGQMVSTFAGIGAEQPNAVSGKGKMVTLTEGGKDFMKGIDSGEGEEGHRVEGGGSSSSTLPRNSRRSSRNEEDGDGRKMVRVAAPQIGNLEMPPEDGFTWRKYGQKEILNSRYPRSYYRCTHQKLYNCPAKKQVQRLDHDPFTFEILYRGDHTCHISSMTPPSPAVQPTLFPQPLQWLTMDFHAPSAEDTHAVLHPHAPSAVGSDLLLHHQHSLLDLADVMFNSGSSSSNNMDVIFSTIDDNKWKNNESKE